MNTTFDVDYVIHDLTVSGYTLNNIYNSIAKNIRGTIEDTILPFVANPMQAQSTAAPYFDGETWYVFSVDTNTYIPTKITVGNVSLSANPTVNRLQRVQSKSDTIALLDDVYGKRNTITLQEGLVVVDWSMATNFRVILSGNRQTVFYMQNSQIGMRVRVLVVNNGTNQTVNSWDSAIKWPGGSAPSVPAADAGGAKSLLATIRNINGTLYGESITQSQGAISKKDITQVPSYNTAGSSSTP